MKTQSLVAIQKELTLNRIIGMDEAGERELVSQYGWEAYLAVIMRLGIPAAISTRKKNVVFETPFGTLRVGLYSTMRSMTLWPWTLWESVTPVNSTIPCYCVICSMRHCLTINLSNNVLNIILETKKPKTIHLSKDMPESSVDDGISSLAKLWDPMLFMTRFWRLDLQKL